LETCGELYRNPMVSPVKLTQSVGCPKRVGSQVPRGSVLLRRSLQGVFPHIKLTTLEIAKGGTIATLSEVPRYNTIRLKGFIHGQRITTLVDSGATHNFIDATLVAQSGLHTEEFEGFTIAVEDGYTMTCLDMVPDLEVKLGNYIVIDTFYVVDLSDTDVVLGVQWLYSLGKIGVNYQTLTMSFRDINGSRVVLRGMSTGAPQAVSTKRMERIFRHGDVAYAAECLINTKRDLDGIEQYHPKIRVLLS
jgi:hypothetical protein